MFNSLWLYVTEACNLRCRYCFNPDEILQEPKTITIEKFREIFDNVMFINEHTQYTHNDELSIVLFGGEPTLYPDLLDQIMKYAHETMQGKIRFSLLTNAYNLHSIKDDILTWKKKYKLNIQLSIDSDPAILSERCNGINHAVYEERINKSLQFLCEHEIIFNIRATLTTNFIHDYAHNFIHFMNYKYNNFNPRATIMPDYIMSVWTDEHYEVVEVQIEKIVAAVLDRYKQSGELYIDKFLQNAFKLLYFKYKEKPVNKKQYTKLCGFCSHLFAVSPDGEIYGCQRVYKQDEMRVGNLSTCSLDFEKITAIKSVYNNRTMGGPHPDIGVADCRECFMFLSCSGICPAENFKQDDTVLNMTCNKTLYMFHKMFYHYTEKYLWPLYDTDDGVKRRILHLVKGK